KRESPGPITQTASVPGSRGPVTSSGTLEAAPWSGGGEGDLCQSLADNAELTGGAEGEVDDPAVGVEAVRDHDDDRAARADKGNPDQRAERQPGMRGRQSPFVEARSARGPPPLVGGSVIGGRAFLLHPIRGFSRGCFTGTAFPATGEVVAPRGWATAGCQASAAAT